MTGGPRVPYYQPMPAETIRTEVAHLTTGVTLVRTYIVTKHGRSIELVTRAQADEVEGADHMGRMNRARLARGQAALVVP